MRLASDRIGGFKVILYTPIDRRHAHTGNCKQFVAGRLAGPAAGLAVCECDGGDGYFLLGCDEEWNPVTDTWHETLEDAKEQAEFEYKGVTQTWQDPASDNLKAS